jgi:hypothetical protein
LIRYTAGIYLFSNLHFFLSQILVDKVTETFRCKNILVISFNENTCLGRDPFRMLHFHHSDIKLKFKVPSTAWEKTAIN